MDRFTDFLKPPHPEIRAQIKLVILYTWTIMHTRSFPQQNSSNCNFKTKLRPRHEREEAISFLICNPQRSKYKISESFVLRRKRFVCGQLFRH